MFRNTIYFAVITVMAAILILSGCTQSKDKVGYVVTQKVFNDFKGTAELQGKFKGLQDRQKYLLDSMALEIRTLEAKNSPVSQVNSKKELYHRLLSEFQQSNGEQQEEYNSGLWKQINQYMQEYGRDKGYAFIYGATGTGNLMYADSTYDVTSEVVQYMNQKYAGK